MIVTIRLFAGARDAVGQDTVSLDVEQDCTVDVLSERMTLQYPEVAGLMSTGRFAVDHQFVDGGFVLGAGRPTLEIAFIPSVSGG